MLVNCDVMDQIQTTVTCYNVNPLFSLVLIFCSVAKFKCCGLESVNLEGHVLYGMLYQHSTLV